MQRIAISLAGHTNLGKTTLARTLLRRDIGVVEDRPHVTDLADGHVLFADDTAELLLWDLPGFGDSVKLRKRLAGSGLMAWLASKFDRWLDRPLWCSQQCLQNAREMADVVLYLVDAQADPADSPEVAAELAVLGWVEKPILLLLNQTGLPDDARDARLAAAWKDAVKDHPLVRDVIPLDGWLRCWIQEVRMMRGLAGHLPLEKRPAFDRLVEEWSRQVHELPFAESMRVLGGALAETAADMAEIGKESLLEKATAVVSRKLTPQGEAARAALVARLVERSRATMDHLLKAHGLDGVPRDRVESFLSGMKERSPGAPPEVWAVLGGIGTGALGGLLADFHTGGLSFGGGAVAGALAGGLAAFALGHGFRKVRSGGVAGLQWNTDFLMQEWQAAAMRYLCVAHLGRGRGQWEEPVPAAWPARWKEQVDAWSTRHQPAIGKALDAADAPAIAALLIIMSREILETLYPPPAA